MATNCQDYQFAEIEGHWQKYWAEHKTFKAPDSSDKPKFYALTMYPYPSGNGLHMGHCENYTGADILARYHRARGRNAMQPMGWDAFGLPTEQSAVNEGIHPRDITARNVEVFRKQLDRLGLALDWDREINTTDPDYVRWTQWIFLQMFKHGLAYVDEQPVWFCPALGTVLANEEVIDGKSERGSHPVERRRLRQWVLRITAYADKLLEGLDGLDWPEGTKRLQRNWIGRSTGANVRFPLADDPQTFLEVYTTRPDTLFGVTYMVLAPEHPLVKQITTADQAEAVSAYVEQVSHKSDMDRTALSKEKTGVFTGAFATNPVNGQRVPIWIADYVLMTYGTGAIMAVPAHDERDYEFAEAMRLPITQVIAEDADDAAKTALPYSGTGYMVHSEGYTGLTSEEGKQQIIADLEAKEHGCGAVNYKLRDWLFSRQRYWGEPFPIAWVDAEGYDKIVAADGEVAKFLPKEPVTFKEDGRVRYAVPIPASQLPVRLPEAEDYRPSESGESPLARQPAWLEIALNVRTGEAAPKTETGGEWVRARRETNTMPQWAGSCWYYLRYLDPDNKDQLIAPEKEAYWGMPDIYIGGPEHAVLHLLYARFWHQFLHDIGVVQAPEPFPRLRHQGMVLGEDGQKMSKSRGNVVNPDGVIAEFGADAVRLFIMFLGPLEDDKPWNTQNMEGIVRFLRRLWREFLDREGKLQTRIREDATDSTAWTRLLHESIKKVGEDIERLRMNTAVSQLMILLNQMQKEEAVSLASARCFIQLLAPLAPHLAEELWARTGAEPSVVDAPWPPYDPAQLVLDEVTIGLLVNGKPRGEASLPKDADEEAALAAARANERVATHLEGKTIRKVIYVPGKILNLVVG